MRPGVITLLAGTHVLELGNGIAGASATAILAALGARVTKRTRLGGEQPPVEPSLETASGRVSILTSLLDRHKVMEATTEAPWAGELPDADVVICDRVADGIGSPADDARYEDVVSGAKRGAWVTLSPFGLTGPYARYRGSELVASAAGGLAATIVARDGSRPTLLPGWQGLLTTGHVAALAALHGLDESRRRRRPVHVDVSAQEAVAMAGALPECAHAIYACPGRPGSGRYVAPSGLFRCRNGFVRIIAPDDHQWAGVVRAMGEPAWTAGLDERPARAEHAQRINRELESWTMTLGIAECADLLQAHGVPATPVNGPDELLESPQFSARAFLDATTVAGMRTRVPGPPYTWAPSGTTTVPDDDRSGLRGLRVAEFAHVLAGPIAGALLGAMGAQVVRFEDLARLDLYRRTGPFARGIPGLERGAYFTVANHSKRSIAVDLDAHPDAGIQLARRSDVVLESFGTKRMKRLGLDADDVRARFPKLLYVSLSGFGHTGPLATYRAYANNVHAYGGLSHLTRDVDGTPVHVGSVLADPLSSITAATVIAAWTLADERPGGTIDLSMAEVVACRLAEFIAEAGAGAVRTAPAGTDRYPYAPHGIHPTADDEWLAIAVHSDAEWTALVDALGRPAALADPTWTRASARWEARRAIAAALDALTSRHSADELFHLLQRAGVPACPVWSGADLISDPHLRERGFFPEIDHPDPDLPDARLVGLAWRFADEGPIPLAPPPRLGNYTLPDEVA